VAVAAATGQPDDPTAVDPDAADARPVWTAVPITAAEIDAARGTLYAQLLTVAATEQAIPDLAHNRAETASAVCKLYFEYRYRLGYDDREAASHAFAEVADGIHSTYEIAYIALSHGTPSPAALERADREQARATSPTTDPDESLQSVRAALTQRRAQASSQRSGPVQDALADLADVFGDRTTAVDVGGHMTCTEADAIARALLAGGHRYAASRWLDGHARGDEDLADDRHVGDGFDLDAYLDGLDPRRVVIGGRERSEHGGLAGAAHDHEKWDPVMRELAGAAVIEDPAWPGLAEPIARAHAAGWDVREGIPRLVTQHQMPDRASGSRTALPAAERLSGGNAHTARADRCERRADTPTGICAGCRTATCAAPRRPTATGPLNRFGTHGGRS
jgi:hypothetical protein